MSETFRRKTVEWFNSTLYTRAEPDASIIVLMTRWHEHDLVGHLLEEHEDNWEEVRLPALAEVGDPLGRTEGQALCLERYDETALESTRKAVGSQVWAALYQQRPVALEGNIIRREWLRYYQSAPDRLDEKAIFADLSFKGGTETDFTVVEGWGRKGANIFLLDQIRGRMGFPEQVRAIRAMADRHPDAYRKQIEEAANGAAVVDTLRNEIGGLVAVKPHTSKEARLAAVSPFYEAGNVHYPDPRSAPWAQINVDELLSFPRARHDDTVDVASQAVFYLGSVSRSLQRLIALSTW